jgi:gliding motility-associated-like protein
MIGFVVAQTYPSHSGNLEFIENKNQWDKDVLYKSDIGGGALFLEKDGFTFAFKDKQALQKLLEFKTRPHSECQKLEPSDFNIKCHAYKLNFIGAKNDVAVTATEPVDGYYNYYTGSDKTKWASKVKSYKMIAYKGLYEKTDLNIYESDSHIKYDIVLNPGADPADIQFQYEGADKVILRNGNLTVKTSVNEVTELSPEAYQVSGTDKVKVTCKFKLTDNILTFIFPDGYDSTKQLVIDPILIFSTYSGSTIDNWGFTATFDSYGDAYSGGIAFGTGYPTSVGAYQENFGGGQGTYFDGCDVAIIKYDSSGTQRLWATYLGGNSEDLPHSMIVNNLDELMVYGTTGSSDFPVTSGSYDVTFNQGDSIMYDYVLLFRQGIDIFVSKLSADGSQLLASTFVGGTKNDGMNFPSVLSKNYADGARGEIMIDANNNVYVASTTNSTDFPVSAGAFQTTAGGGGQDGCVFKMDANLSNLIWSSYLGGNKNDAAYGIELDDNNNVFITGGTTSTNFPTTAGVLYPVYHDSTDGFITKISTNGNSILRSTYYGSDKYDQSYLIKKDKAGYIYVFGQTAATGNTFIFNASWFTPGGGQFISKIDPDLNALVWSTAFGTGSGGPDISPTAFLVDLCKKIYLSGWGGGLSGFGGTAGLPITANAFQTTTDDNDYYFLVISDDASSIIYGSFFGSPLAQDHVDGGTSRFDRKGRIYQSVCAGCGNHDDFPTTPGAWSNTNNSLNCNNALIKFDFRVPLVIAEFDIPPVGCVPYTVNFHNTSYVTSTAGVNYYWTFGDGGSSTVLNPSYTYNQSGVYNVTLIVSDTGSCNLSDTISHQVVILDNTTDTLQPLSICSGDFTQIGLLPLPDTSLTYQWIPANYLSSDTISNPIATPGSTTTYLLLISNGICTDSIYQTVNVTTFSVDAGPDTTICPSTILLSATSIGGATTFIWSSTPNFADTLNFPLTNNTVTVSPTTETTYYVYASNQICTRIDSVTVHISLVNINAGVSQGICDGDTVSISVTNLNPSNPLTYSWSPTSSIVSGSNSSTAFVNPSDTTTYIVVATDTMGCTKTDTVTITVSNILANLVTDSVLCSGDCNGYALVNPSGGLAPYSFLWSTGSSLDSIGGLCANNYSVLVQDSLGCQKTYPFTIYSPMPLSISITDTFMVDCDSVCDGYATVLVTGGTLSYQYTWIDGQTTVTADSLCAGSYSVTVTDHNNCAITLPVIITDTSNFDALIDSIIPPLCYGFCDGLAYASASGGVLPYDFDWDTGDTLTYSDSLCAGNHNVMIFESGGCIRNMYFTVQQPTSVIMDLLNVVNPSCNNICDGQLFIDGTGGTPPYTYLWSTGQTTTSIDSLCGGNYYVTVYDNHNCPDIDTLTLIEPTPLLLNTTSTNVPCVEVCNGVATAVSSGSTPPYSYLWSNGYDDNPAIDLCPGTYYVTVTDAHLCTALDTIVVHDSTTFPPNIYSYADDTVIYNSQSTGLHTTFIPGYTYSWTPSGNLNNHLIYNPVASPTSTTTYIVTIVDPFGCTYTDTVIVVVIDVLCDESQIFMPNAFTPNNDNNNDVLYVRSNIIKAIYLAIYDRWGEKVFETTDMNQGWDGTFRGMDCDPGVFDYYLKVTCINDMEFIKKGNITLIR